jgi:hypothetical protein
MPIFCDALFSRAIQFVLVIRFIDWFLVFIFWFFLLFIYFSPIIHLWIIFWFIKKFIIWKLSHFKLLLSLKKHEFVCNMNIFWTCKFFSDCMNIFFQNHEYFSKLWQILMCEIIFYNVWIIFKPFFQTRWMTFKV